MSLMWVVYLAGVVSNLGIVAGISMVVGIISSLISSVVVAGISSEKSRSKVHMDNYLSALFALKLTASIALVGMTLTVFLPSEKTMYTMAGVYAAETVITSETGQEIFDEVKETIMYQLQQYQGDTDSK